MPKRKKETTLEDCIAIAETLQESLNSVYQKKKEAELYSNIITVEDVIRNLITKIKNESYVRKQ